MRRPKNMPHQQEQDKKRKPLSHSAKTGLLYGAGGAIGGAAAGYQHDKLFGTAPKKAPSKRAKMEQAYSTGKKDKEFEDMMNRLWGSDKPSPKKVHLKSSLGQKFAAKMRKLKQLPGSIKNALKNGKGTVGNIISAMKSHPNKGMIMGALGFGALAGGLGYADAWANERRKKNRRTLMEMAIDTNNIELAEFLQNYEFMNWEKKKYRRNYGAINRNIDKAMVGVKVDRAKAYKKALVMRKIKESMSRLKGIKKLNEYVISLGENIMFGIQAISHNIGHTGPEELIRRSAILVRKKKGLKGLEQFNPLNMDKVKTKLRTSFSPGQIPARA